MKVFSKSKLWVNFTLLGDLGETTIKILPLIKKFLNSSVNAKLTIFRSLLFGLILCVGISAFSYNFLTQHSRAQLVVTDEEFAPNFQVTQINLPSSRIPYNIPTDIPRDGTGATISQNYVAFTDDNVSQTQGTRDFTINNTLDEAFNTYLNYFNSHNYEILTTNNNPDSKSITGRLVINATQRLVGQILIYRNTITSINQVRFNFSRIGNTCVIPPSGLISWYYGEGNVNDSFGNNDGFLRNGATATAQGPASHGQAFGFDGVDDYIEIPDSPSLKPQTISVEAWVKFDSLDTPGATGAGLQYLVFKKNTHVGQFEGYNLHKYRDTNGVDRISFSIASANGLQILTNSTSPVVINQFYHLVGTYDGSTVKLYVNGALEDTKAANFPLDYGTRPVFIGSSGETFFDGKFKGIIDEVGIYNRAVNAAEVQNIFESGGKGKCRGAPSNPVLNINPTSGFQQGTTFTYDGGWYSPGGGIRQFLTFPNGTTQELNQLTANASGQFNTFYTTSCSDAVGNYSIRMQDVATNRQSNVANFTVNASPGCIFSPSINAITPSTVIVNQPTTLTVNGSSFQSNFTAEVTTPAGTFPIAPAGLTFVNASQVRVQVTMGSTPPYTATLKIKNPDLQSATRAFQVTASTSAPEITGILPETITANKLTEVMVNGNNFPPATDFIAEVTDDEGTTEVPLAGRITESSSLVKLRFMVNSNNSFAPSSGNLRIRDRLGRFTSRVFQITPNSPPTTSLKIKGIEVTQGIQDINTSHRQFVAGRPTFVRVHVQSTGNAVSGVTAKLVGKRGGVILGNAIASNASSSIEVKSNPQRAQLNDSFIFRLPPDWITETSGLQNLGLEFSGISHQFSCDSSNPVCNRVAVRFSSVPKIEIQLVKIIWRNNRPLIDASLENIKAEIRKSLPLPVSESDLIFPAPIELRINDNEPRPTITESLLQRVAALCNGCTNSNTINKHYLGLLSGQQAGDANGLGNRPGFASVAFVEPLFSRAHELAHNFGRAHTNTGGPMCYDTRYPYSNGRISQDRSDNGYFGFDILTNQIHSPNITDLMGYESAGVVRWASDYTSKGIIDSLNNVCSTLTLGNCGNNTSGKTCSLRPFQSQEMLLSGETVTMIKGSISLTNNTGQVSSIYSTIAPLLTGIPNSGEYALRYEANGQVWRPIILSRTFFPKGRMRLLI